MVSDCRCTCDHSEDSHSSGAIMNIRKFLNTVILVIFILSAMKRKNDKRNENRRQARAIKKRKAIAQLELAVRERNRSNCQQRRVNSTRNAALQL